MKKEVILALAFLFNLQLVNAQEEITILGKSYPIILVAPIFFMGLIALFFFGLILKDNIGKLKLPKINLSKIKIKYGKKESQEIKIDFRTKFYLLKEKAHKIGAQQSFTEFSEVAKEFLKQKFNLKHEFAFAELGNLVKGHVKDVELANKISALKYSGANIDLLQIKLLFKEFEVLLKEYKFKSVETELGFFGRVKTNLLDLFKRKEIKLDIKELRIKAPIKPIPKPREIYKPILFSKLLGIFKKKEKIETRIIKEAKQVIKPAKLEIKKPEVEAIQAPAEIVEIKPKRKFKFILFTNLSAKIQKFRILNLIKQGKKAVFKNSLSAKRYYARALLSYYKLPIQEEKEIADKLMELHNEILYHKKNEKMFLDVSKNLIEMKHKGKHVSKEALSMLNTLKNFIQREELLVATRLKEFSYKLKHEERKLGHFIKKEEGLIGGKIKEDVKRDLGYMESGFKEEESKLKHFLHKEKHKIGKLFEKQQIKEIPKQEIAKKTITLVDQYKPRLEFLYKQPKVAIKHEKVENEEPRKLTSRQLRLLQKQRNELYNKLLELEEGKITHDKLN